MPGQYPFQDMPGPAAVELATPRKILRSYPSSVVLLGVAIDSTAADSTNSPTTELRAGLVMGLVTATGLAKQYSPTATDGTQIPVGILYEDRRMVDPAGTARQETGQLVVAGVVITSSIIGSDDVCRQAFYGRIIYDDRYFGVAPDLLPPLVKATNYTVLATDTGKSFSTRGAGGAVVFTLPTTLVKGFRARFQNEVDQNMTVTAPAGKLVGFNNLVGTSIAFSTAGNKISACVEITVNDDASKYVAMVYAPHTATVT